MSTLLTRLFSIRPGEENKTLLLLSLHFTFYVGLRWGEHASETLFLNARGANALSLMFIGNAILSFAMALAFTFLADRISNARLLIGMCGAIILWLGSVWLWLGQTPVNERGLVYPYFYLVFTAFGDIATLNILNYINDFYDTRAAKRALPLMLSGAIAGSTVAGFSVPLLNQAIGLRSVPLAWGACLILVIALIYTIRRRLAPEITELQKARRMARGATRTKAGEGVWANLRDGLTFVRDSGLLRWLALATLATTLLMRILTFQASAVFVAQFKDDPAGLFNFYGVLGGVANIAGLLIQSLLLSRLISHFGVGKMNLVFPSLTLLAVGALNGLPGMATAIFGRLDHTVLKQVFRNPLDAMLLNAVPLQIKGRARGFMKLVVPIGTLIAGLTLLAVQVGGWSLWIIGVLAVSIAVIYVAASAQVNREYMRSLARLIADADEMSIFRASRDTSRDEFEQPDPATLSQLYRRLQESKSDEMTVFMTEMIYEIQERDALPQLQALYHARGPRVRASLVQMLGADWISDPIVRGLCFEAVKDGDVVVRQAGVIALTRAPNVARDDTILAAFKVLLDDPDEGIQAEVIPILIASGDPDCVTPAKQRLAQWLSAESDSQHRALGLRVLSKIGDKELLQQLEHYLNDPTPLVRRQAADLLGDLTAHTKSAGVQREGIAELRKLLGDKDEAVRLAAVNGIGQLKTVESNLALLAAFSDDSLAVRRQACALSEVAIKPELEQALECQSPYLVECAAFLLARANHPRAKHRVVELMEGLVTDVYTLHAQRLAMGVFDTTGARLLTTTLREQANLLLDRAFWLLSVFADDQQVQSIRRALPSASSVTRANAVETIESMTSPRLAGLIAPLFDGTPLAQLVEIGRDKLGLTLPSRREILCQAWPQLCDRAARVINPNLAALYKDGWLSATAMYTVLELDAQKIDSGERPSLDEVRRALQLTVQTGTPLAQETARRVLALLEATQEPTLKEQAMLTTIEKVIFLKEVPFFQDMTIDQLRILAGISEEVTHEQGQRIFAQGEYGDALHIIVSGRVAIQQAGRRRGSITRLATLGPKEYFAEMSIFDNAPHSADAVALEPTELLLVRQAPLVALIKHQPDLGLSLLKVMSQRLRQANAQLAEKTQAKPKELVDLYDKL